jgi:hypothetical protein
MKKNNMKNYKKYIIWFIIWISWFYWYTFASNWDIWSLFSKVWTRWYFQWWNIKEWTISPTQLWQNSVTTEKILNRNVTESKLSTSLQTKINSAIQVETNPRAVKLVWDQNVNWIKYFDTSSSYLLRFRWRDSLNQTTNAAWFVSAEAFWLSTWRYDLAFLIETWASRNFYMKTNWWRFILNTDNINAEIIAASVRMTAPNPVASNHVATKWYVDSSISSYLNPIFTHSWTFSSWSTCVNQVQYRQVSCARNTWVLVFDSNCTWSKPATVQACINNCILDATLDCIL